MPTPIPKLGKMPLESKDILTWLPHRYPFLLIDRVFSLEGGSMEDRKGRRVHARKCITMNEPYFTGHFPDNPIAPGVLLLEIMAQASAVSTIRPGQKDEERNFFIASANKVKFRQPTVPGDVLDVFGECIRDRGSMLIYNCYIECDGKRKCEAELWAKVF